MKILIYLTVVLYVSNNCHGFTFPAEKKIKQMFMSTSNGTNVTSYVTLFDIKPFNWENLYQIYHNSFILRDYNALKKMDKYYITMETEDSPLTTYELDIKNKQNVCEFKVKGGTFYICYTVRFHSETGDVYTYEDYWLNLDLNHPLGFSVYKRTQYAKIAENHGLTFDDIQSASMYNFKQFSMIDSDIDLSLNLDVKYLVDYDLQKAFGTKEELIKFVYAVNGQADYYFKQGLRHPMSVSVHNIKFLTEEETKQLFRKYLWEEMDFYFNMKLYLTKTAPRRKLYDTVVLLTANMGLLESKVSDRDDLYNKHSWAAVGVRKEGIIHAATSVAKSLGTLLGLKSSIGGYCAYPSFQNMEKKNYENPMDIMDPMQKEFLFKDHTWSECNRIASMYYFRKYLPILTKNSVKRSSPPTKYPGTDYSFEQQCENLGQLYGNRTLVPMINPVWPYYTCTELICAVPREAKLFDYGFVVELIVKNYSQSLVTDVLQGTKCGEGMVCSYGWCVNESRIKDDV